MLSCDAGRCDPEEEAGAVGGVGPAGQEADLVADRPGWAAQQLTKAMLEGHDAKNYAVRSADVEPTPAGWHSAGVH